jgi:hypothetical protein
MRSIPRMLLVGGVQEMHSACEQIELDGMLGMAVPPTHKWFEKFIATSLLAYNAAPKKSINDDQGQAGGVT